MAKYKLKGEEYMRKIYKMRSLVSAFAVSLALVASYGASALAAPATGQTPPASRTVSGPQAKPPVQPGSVDAKATPKLGATQELKVGADGKAAAEGFSTLAGSVANIDFQTPLNYCYRNLVYTPVKNDTGATKYAHIMLYNQGMYRGDTYVTITNGTVNYPAFYGIDGAYTAYMYVWNGTSYAYDEYVSGTNTCNVSVTRTYNTGGWVQLKIQNLGTAYASQVSSELAPYPASGTYTGTHYDYPVAGGAAIYRWFSVGTSPYAITSYTSGSWNAPYNFTGDL